MPRPKIIGVLLLLFSALLAVLFCYYVFASRSSDLSIMLSFLSIDVDTYYILSAPFILVTFIILGTGFWMGLTILSIKVVPIMPELIKKRDFTKPKAVILCIVVLLLLAAFVYGLYLKSFWALAVPATIITFVILGAVFWVGLAIVTTRATLPQTKSNSESDGK